jgi:uncharacterized alpha-E superfamily protein
LDLPSSVELGWEPIIDILSFRNTFYELHEKADEESVIDFMLVDKKHSGSIISSLSAARENARTVKEIIPREAWEQINELYHFVTENSADAFKRRTRYQYLSKIILANQTITGLLAGTMTHDEAYLFIRIGRNLERADMTTRILDVRSASLLPELENELPAFRNIQWMGVLKSMTAYQMYRREVRVRINRKDVLEFLLLESRFPRSLIHAIEQVERSLSELPHNKEAVDKTRILRNYLLNAKPAVLEQEKLHDFIDDIQLGLIEVNEKVSDTYF